MLIEPFVEINLLQLFGEVMTSFFISPLGVAGSSFNRFFRDFFMDTPFHILLLQTFLLVLFLFCVFGYKFRTILWSVEPSFAPVAAPSAQVG